jgi:hypothetical protein
MQQEIGQGKNMLLQRQKGNKMTANSMQVLDRVRHTFLLSQQ